MLKFKDYYKLHEGTDLAMITGDWDFNRFIFNLPHALCIEFIDECAKKAMNLHYDKLGDSNRTQINTITQNIKNNKYKSDDNSSPYEMTYNHDNAKALGDFLSLSSHTTQAGNAVNALAELSHLIHGKNRFGDNISLPNWYTHGAVLYINRAGIPYKEIQDIFVKHLNEYVQQKYGEHFNPQWKTSTLIGLLNEFSDNPQETNTLGIIADALQDAGLDNEKIINDLRENKNSLIIDWIMFNTL